MASRTNGYDSSLIKDAPELTKADKQEGYNIDLLEQGRTKSVDPHGAGRSTRRPPGAAPAAAAAASPYPAQKVYNEKPLAPVKKQPFYRTKKGLIIIGAVAFVVILAVALGAGIGIAKNKNNNNNNNNTEASPTRGEGEASSNGGKPTNTIPFPTLSGDNTQVSADPGKPTATTRGTGNTPGEEEDPADPGAEDTTSVSGGDVRGPDTKGKFTR